jgi:hypothetical protein
MIGCTIGVGTVVGVEVLLAVGVAVIVGGDMAAVLVAVLVGLAAVVTVGLGISPASFVSVAVAANISFCPTHPVSSINPTALIIRTIPSFINFLNLHLTKFYHILPQYCPSRTIVL